MNNNPPNSNNGNGGGSQQQRPNSNNSDSGVVRQPKPQQMQGRPIQQGQPVPRPQNGQPNGQARQGQPNGQVRQAPQQGQPVQKPQNVQPQVNQQQVEQPINNNSNNTISDEDKKAKKKKAIIITISIVLFLLIGTPLTVWYIGESLVKKDEVVVALNSTIDGLNEKISQLNDAVADTTVQEVIQETSLQYLDGSLVPHFVTLDEKLILPNKFELPNSTEDINNSYLMVGSKFKFYPSNNWITKLQGATLQLSHPSNITGMIKAVSIPEATKDEELMKQLLQDFFVGYPATTITYRKVFIEDRVAGMMATAPITVDEKETYVVVGFAQRSESAVLWLFNGANDGTSVQLELIDLFLSTGTYNESRLKLE